MPTVSVSEADKGSQALSIGAVPPQYLLQCGPLPVLSSGEIEILKSAYKRTQSQLIRVCDRHGDLVGWLLQMIEAQNDATP